MAPLSMGDGMAHAVQQLIVQRSLGNAPPGTSQVVTASQGLALQCLALVFSTFSVASAILAFYWFIKMRRSFRHDLIMLLIQSDMFKALWFMLYPIVTFAYGPVQNDSKFCQVQGFFLALGTEASDFAILMIAIHTSLYIFKPRTSAAEGGLYKYRYIAYTLWAIFPVTMASLAFVNENGGYVSDGTYCYLPVRPFWFRLALGWIPRYIIFIVIVAIYVSIYYYVRYKFHGFSKQGKDNSTSTTKKDLLTTPPHAAKQHSLPPTPNLTYHGMIPDSRQSSYAEPPPEESLERRQSILTPHSEAHKFIWGSFIAKGDSVQPSTPPPTPPSESSTLVADSGADLPVPNPVFQPSTISFEPSRQPPRQISEDESNQRTREHSWTANTPNHSSRSSSTKPWMISMLSVFRLKPDSTQSTSPMSQLELVNSKGQNMAVSEMVKTREKIRRQLRFLFIYPLVYMAMWALPFVTHVLQYSDRYATNPPFALNCLTTVFVACQAAVDCWLFSTREKPWRHIPGNESDQNFWGSLKFWSGWKEIRARRKYVTTTGPGKTRQEMAREARQAYKRRDEELAQRRTDSLGTSEFGGTKRERSWWEGKSDSGADPSAMSPIAEIRNPMDFVTIPEGEATADTDKGKRVVEPEGDGHEHTDTK